jgi:hypothetical protein
MQQGVISKCSAGVREILYELRQVLEQATSTSDNMTGAAAAAATTVAATGTTTAAATGTTTAAADSMVGELPLLDDTGTTHNSQCDSYSNSSNSVHDGSFEGNADDASSCDMSIDSDRTSTHPDPTSSSANKGQIVNSDSSSSRDRRSPVLTAAAALTAAAVPTAGDSSSSAVLNPSHRVALYTAEQWHTLAQRMAAVMASLPVKHTQDSSSSSSSSDAPLNLFILAGKLCVHEHSIKELYCSYTKARWEAVSMKKPLTQQQLAGLAQYFVERAATAASAGTSAAASAANAGASGSTSGGKHGTWVLSTNLSSPRGGAGTLKPLRTTLTIHCVPLLMQRLVVHCLYMHYRRALYDRDVHRHILQYLHRLALATAAGSANSSSLFAVV